MNKKELENLLELYKEQLFIAENRDDKICGTNLISIRCQIEEIEKQIQEME